MAKFGYRCKCGWTLRRGKQTRRQYADAKRAHAAGYTTKDGVVPPCEDLARELARTKR